MPKPANREDVRLSTVTYTGAGRHSGCFQLAKHLRIMRRLSHGHGLLEEAVSNIGASEALNTIVNLHECPDGLYDVVICNIRTSWETPDISDDWDLKLVPWVLSP